MIETQYFPSIAWCSTVWQQKTALIDAAEHYQKGGLRNRCYIAGPNGLQRLSIPLAKGKHQQTPIREVRIAYEEPWQRQHWRSIQAAYGSAPYFEHYADDIRAFLEKRYAFLFDLNLDIQRFMLNKKLGWEGEFVCQTQFVPKGQWPGGPDFRDNQWAVSIRPYAQVFLERHGFLPNLSVLDLLFCCGKTGREVLADAVISPN